MRWRERDSRQVAVGDSSERALFNGNVVYKELSFFTSESCTDQDLPGRDRELPRYHVRGRYLP
jgi:hypothetical protein